MVAFDLFRMRDALLILCWCLADDQRVPMVIRSQDQMRGDGCAYERAMQLDLEQPPQFGGHMQMLPVVIQPHIAVHFILAELDTMPAVGRLEARKAAGQTQLLHLKETLERLAEPVSQCLHCGC